MISAKGKSRRTLVGAVNPPTGTPDGSKLNCSTVNFKIDIITSRKIKYWKEISQQNEKRKEKKAH